MSISPLLTFTLPIILVAEILLGSKSGLCRGAGHLREICERVCPSLLEVVVA